MPVIAAGVDPYDAKAEAPHEMVSFTGSFHGRTLGALALTYKDAYKIPFAPGVPGARMVKYLDLDAAAAVIQKVELPCNPLHMGSSVCPVHRLKCMRTFVHVMCK